MGKRHFWGAGITGAGEGILEGLDVGTKMRKQRVEERQVAEEAEQNRLTQALAMIVAGGKAEDPGVVNAINQLLRLNKGAGGVQIPPYDPKAAGAKAAEQAGAGYTALNAEADKLGLPKGSPEREQFIFQKVLTEKKERSPYVIGDKTYMLTDEQAARMDMQVQLKEMAHAMRGGGSGGSGGSKESTMIVPDNKGGFKLIKLPPGKYRNAPSWLGKPEDAPQPQSSALYKEALDIQTKIGKGTATSQDIIRGKELGVEFPKGGLTRPGKKGWFYDGPPQVDPVSVSATKKAKKQPKQMAQPQDDSDWQDE
jgi:hypothetical protein